MLNKWVAEDRLRRAAGDLLAIAALFCVGHGEPEADVEAQLATIEANIVAIRQAFDLPTHEEPS